MEALFPLRLIGPLPLHCPYRRKYSMNVPCLPFAIQELAQWRRKANSEGSQLVPSRKTNIKAGSARKKNARRDTVPRCPPLVPRHPSLNPSQLPPRGKEKLEPSARVAPNFLRLRTSPSRVPPRLSPERLCSLTQGSVNAQAKTPVREPTPFLLLADNTESTGLGKEFGWLRGLGA